MSAHKVVVREIAQGMVAAAVHGSTIVPDHKLYVIPCQTPAEADLLAEVLSSPIVDYMIRSVALSTSITGSFLRYVGIRDLSQVTESGDRTATMAMGLGLSPEDHAALLAIAQQELERG